MREANAKARQEHLDQREEKRQEGKLRRASGENDRASSSMVCPPTKKKKKKKTNVKTTKALTPVPTSPSTFTPSTSNSTDSSIQAFEVNFDLPEF